jgi:hypothetical protein
MSYPTHPPGLHSLNAFKVAGSTTVCNNTVALKYYVSFNSNKFISYAPPNETSSAGDFRTQSPAIEMKLLWGAVGLSFNAKSDVVTMLMAVVVLWAMAMRMKSVQNVLRVAS